MFRRYARQVWDSPTMMTWASFGARTLNVGVVLLLVVHHFPQPEVALWLLFLEAINFQFMLDMGFMLTFARVIAYAMGGASDLGDFRSQEAKGTGEPNWLRVEQIVATTRVTYRRLAFGMIGFALLVITPLLIGPIGLVEHPHQAWMAWAVIVVSSASILYGRVYACYLQGANEVPRWRRSEAFTGLAAACCCIITLLAGGGILGLVLARQLCYMAGNLLYNRHLCRVVQGQRWKTFRVNAYDADVFRQIWTRSWRTGIGVLISHGMTRASSFIYAQFGSIEAVSSYLLAIKAVDTTALFSQAPFYSKLPYLARLRSAGQMAEQVRVAQRGMGIAFWVFVGGMLAAGFFAPPLIEAVQADTRFVAPILWAVICVAYFIQRHDAMHLQFYSLTNHIIWHKVNAVTAAVVIIITLSLAPRLGIVSFPIALMVGHLTFYTWYVTIHSHRAFHLRFPSYELKTSTGPLVVMLAALALYVYFFQVR